MRALLDETQQEFQGVAHDIARSIGLQNPSDLEDRASGWATFASAGLLELRERADGEPAASGVEVALLVAEFGAALVPDSFLPSGVVAGDLLARAGADSAVLAALGAGQELTGILLNAELSEFAAPDAGGAAVWGGAGDDGHVLSLRPAQTGAAQHGFDLLRGRTRGATRLETVSPTNALWRAESLEWERVGTLSAEDAQRSLALTLVGLSADTVGALDQALKGVIEYSKQRVAYGVHIGSFQAIQHIAADAFVAIAGARSATLYAAWAVDTLDSADALLAARTAKAACAHIGHRTGEDVMQIYGGIGQTWEHIAHFYTRRAMFNSAVLGGENHQLDAIADVRLEGK